MEVLQEPPLGAVVPQEPQKERGPQEEMERLVLQQEEI
jgi:hypothetical protein